MNTNQLHAQQDKRAKATPENMVAWSPETPIQIPQNSWLFPNQDCAFFCDLHADAEALLRSLKACHLISQDSDLTKIELTPQGQSTQIIIGGDCFDKGPSNLKLFMLLSQLKRHGAQLILLAGNHDIRIYAGLKSLLQPNDPKQSHFFTRMGRKTAALFAEIFQTYFVDAGLQESDLPSLSAKAIKRILFPNMNWANDFSRLATPHLTAIQIEKEIERIHFKRHDFLKACAERGMNLQQTYWSIQKAHELFIDSKGEFAWFFQEIQLLFRAGSYLFCHAGVDDQIAQLCKDHSLHEINEHFQIQLHQGQLFELYYNAFGNVFRTKYRKSDKPLTLQGTQMLRSLDIYAIVNGHRSHENGQQLFVRDGLLNFECDTQLNANCRKRRNISTPGYAATLFYSNGLVSAFSSELTNMKMFDPRHLKHDLSA